MKTVKINGAVFRNMVNYGVYNLSKNKAELDSLNIFPVPDGDTGTNMSLTAKAAVNELTKLSNNCKCFEAADAVARGSLRGARGNSGVILSQLFRGFSKGLKGKDEITTADFAYALNVSQETAYKAVMKPKEGTVLTVARVIAERAAEISKTKDDFNEFFTLLLKTAHTVLAETTQMLPALKAAGVVDAGGKGLVYIYEGMKDGITLQAPDVDTLTDDKQEAPLISAAAQPAHIEFAYCTEFFIQIKDASDKISTELSDFLMNNGDSVIAVNDDELIKVHVHTNNPGVVLEYSLKIGPLINIKIENMCYQHTSLVNNGAPKTTEEIKSTPPDKTNKNIGTIAVCAGDGIHSILMDLGCDTIIKGGQTMNPSTDDILKAAESIKKDNIIILPNNKNIVLAAKQAAEIIEKELGKRAVVVSAKTMPEGIAAMVAMVHGKPFEETWKLMAEAVQSVKTGHVTEAVRDTEIDGKKIKQGDFLGLVSGEIIAVTNSAIQAAKAVVDKISEESEIISVYYGQRGSEVEGGQICDYIDEIGLEGELLYGGQPVYSYLLSGE